ncbi:MAG TPA: hypothetical protein PLZ45_02285 [Ferruginibacter sp.]|nr:hypothetical protein [Chitinophagaceae bacterium]HRI23470.1 hypothetical protein [Ferruginibacter sp.]
MKKFKTTDAWISTGLILSFVIINIINKPSGLIDESILTGYFVVGGWQVVSMLVHAYKHWFTEKWSARYVYHWVTFISLVTMPGSFWVLAITAPFMALYYTVLCFLEIGKMNERPLNILK